MSLPEATGVLGALLGEELECALLWLVACTC